MAADDIRDAEIRRAAEIAAKAAVAEVFSRLGVDITQHDAINAFRDDLVWARKQRAFNESVGSRVVVTMISILTGAVLVAAWDYLTRRFSGT